MSQSLFYNCKFHIIRQGTDYGLRKQDLVSILRLFVNQQDRKEISLGGGFGDDIYLKNHEEGHLKFHFKDGCLVLEARETVQLLTKEFKKKLISGQKIRLLIPPKGYHFKLIFPNKTSVMGKIFPEEEQIPQQWINHLTGKYGEIEKIQEGKSSLIYKTKQNSIIKVLRPSFAKNKGVFTRFLNAAKKFRELDDPSFLKVLEIISSTKNSFFFVVMNYFKGETLENYIAKNGVLDFDEGKEITLSIAQNLAVVEKHNSPFRNLSPGNILLSPSKKTRITGFFLLKSEVDLTALGAQMVIPKFTAPEQIRNPATVDILSDMFSLGAIFHNLVIGEPPFQATNVGQYIQRLSTATSVRPEEIQALRPSLSLEETMLISNLLSFEKEGRPTPSEFIRASTQQEQEDYFEDDYSEDESMFLEVIDDSLSGETSSPSGFFVEDTMDLEEEVSPQEDPSSDVFLEEALPHSSFQEDTMELPQKKQDTVSRPSVSKPKKSTKNDIFLDEETMQLLDQPQAVELESSRKPKGIFSEDTLELSDEDDENNSSFEAVEVKDSPEVLDEVTLELLDETHEAMKKERERIYKNKKRL